MEKVVIILINKSLTLKKRIVVLMQEAFFNSLTMYIATCHISTYRIIFNYTCKTTDLKVHSM